MLKRKRSVSLSEVHQAWRELGWLCHTPWGEWLQCGVWMGQLWERGSLRPRDLQKRKKALRMLPESTIFSHMSFKLLLPQPGKLTLFLFLTELTVHFVWRLLSAVITLLKPSLNAWSGFSAFYNASTVAFLSFLNTGTAFERDSLITAFLFSTNYIKYMNQVTCCFLSEQGKSC